MKFYGLPALLTDEKVDARKAFLRRLGDSNFRQLLETNLSFEDSLHLSDGVKYRPGRFSAPSAPGDAGLFSQLHSPFSGTGRTLTGKVTAVIAKNTDPAIVFCGGKWCGADDGLVEVVALDGGRYREHWNNSGKRSTSEHSADEVSNSNSSSSSE